MSWQTRRAWLLVAILLAPLLACSAGNNGLDRVTPGGKQDPVQLPNLLRSLVRAEPRFVGYVRGAGRVTVIDPVSLEETWGLNVGDSFDGALPLAGLDGIALLGGSMLALVSGGDRRDFDLAQIAGGSRDVAADAPTFAVADASYAQFHVVRATAPGQFQDETRPLPFAVGQRTDVVPVFSADGRTLFAVDIRDGGFMILRAPNATASLAGPTLTCDGSHGLGGVIEALVYDDARDQLIAAVAGGTLRTISGAATTCPTISTPALASSSAGGSVLRLSFVGTDTLAVSSTLPTFQLATLPPAGQPAPSTTIDLDHGARALAHGRCAFPLALLRLSPARFGYTCLDQATVSNNTLHYASASFVAVEDAGGVEHGPISLPLPSDIGGLTVTPDGESLVFLRHTAIGSITTFDLVSGEQATKRGLFTHHILNSN